MNTRHEVQAERLEAIKSRHANFLDEDWAFDDIAWLVNRADERDQLRAENERLQERAAYAERVWKELGASREQVQAENERLREDLGAADADVETLQGIVKTRDAEIERLRAALDPSRGREVAEMFHDTYERLAPTFGYETREETRRFDPTTPNGALMIAVATHVLGELAGLMSR